MPKATVDEVINELKGIIWEAEEAEFFSIDDLKPLVNSLQGIEWPEEKVVASITVPALGKGILAWVAIPFFVVLLPFAYLYSVLFQRK